MVEISECSFAGDPQWLRKTQLMRWEFLTNASIRIFLPNEIMVQCALNAPLRFNFLEKPHGNSFQKAGFCIGCGGYFCFYFFIFVLSVHFFLKVFFSKVLFIHFSYLWGVVSILFFVWIFYLVLFVSFSFYFCCVLF